MRRSALSLALALATVSLVALPGACGGSKSSGGSTTSHGGAGGTGTGGSTGTAGGIGFDAGGGDGSAALGCSADLHGVVDANGTVVMTCPSDQGCAAGACVPACQAAAASAGNVGCDFLVPTPPSYPPDLPPCFAVFVANTWPMAANLTVSVGATSYDVTQFGRIPVNGMPESAWPAVGASGLGVNQVAVLFLSADPNSVFSETGEPMKCPVSPAVNAATSLQQTGKQPGDFPRLGIDTARADG